MAHSDVVVPGSLHAALLRVLTLGLREQSQRDGGVQPVPGLARFLQELHESASGPGLARIEPSPYTGWVPVSEAAQLAAVSDRHVRRLAASGRLIARRPGRDWEIDRQSAQDYAKERGRCSAA